MSNIEAKEKVLECVDETDLIELAKGMLSIPSFQTEETCVAEYLGKWMSERGFDVEMQEVEEGRFQPVGRLKGSGGGPVLVFNGHMDIDAYFEGLIADPFKPVLLEIDGEKRLFGQGLFNMKGGVTCFLIAGDAIKRAVTKHGLKLKGDLILSPVVGETQGGIGTRHLLRTYFPKHGIWPDAALVAEPYGHTVCTVNAGNVGIQINVYGETQHISRMEKSADALEMMIKVIEALKKIEFTYEPREDVPGLPRMLISTIVGGRRRILMESPGYYFDLRSGAFACDQCTIVIDVRTIVGQTPESVREDFEKVLKKVKEKNPELEYEMRIPVDKKFETHRYTVIPLDVPVDEYIVQSTRQAYKYVWGKEPLVGAVVPSSYAYNDTAHFWEAGIPCCLHGTALGGKELPEQYKGMFHKKKGSLPNYITIDEMVGVAKVFALTALDILTKTREEIKKA
jgi:acetylornithine deacetylase